MRVNLTGRRPVLYKLCHSLGHTTFTPAKFKISAVSRPIDTWDNLKCRIFSMTWSARVVVAFCVLMSHLSDIIKERSVIGMRKHNCFIPMCFLLLRFRYQVANVPSQTYPPTPAPTRPPATPQVTLFPTPEPIGTRTFPFDECVTEYVHKLPRSWRVEWGGLYEPFRVRLMPK